MKNKGKQRAKKVASDSPGLVDFAIGLVNSVLNLPNGQVKYVEEFNLQKNCEINSVLVEMTFGLINASFSLPKWQAVKMTFLAPWEIKSEPRINLNHNIIHVTLLKLLLHIQYPQLLPISLTTLETKLQISLEFVFFVLHKNGDIHCRQYVRQDGILGKMYCK